MSSIGESSPEAQPADRLSIPARVSAPPRPLTPQEWEALLVSADLLIPGSGAAPAASAAPGYRDWAEVALAARAEHFGDVVDVLAEVGTRTGEQARTVLRALSTGVPKRFEVFTAVLAGAYLMVPEVRQLLGYPGQGRNVPSFDEAFEQLEDGILDPVMDRGPFYVDPTAVSDNRRSTNGTAVSPGTYRSTSI